MLEKLKLLTDSPPLGLRSKVVSEVACRSSLRVSTVVTDKRGLVSLDKSGEGEEIRRGEGGGGGVRKKERAGEWEEGGEEG